MDEKETICQIRLFTSGLCEVEFSVEIGCREVAVTKCPAPYKVTAVPENIVLLVFFFFLTIDRW